MTFVPSDCRRSQKSSGKSAARFAVESSAALRATLLTSLMNSNFSVKAEPEAFVAMRPNFVKFASSPYTMMPACWYWTVPWKLSFVIASQAPSGASRTMRFFASLRVW